MTARKIGAVVFAYLAITLVMTHPLINLSALSTAIYPGDARLIAWTLGWDNHALLTGRALFDANFYYPAANSLQYAEHHVGISLFTLPIYAATHNVILGYNLVWFMTFLLDGLSMHALIYTYTRRHLASLVGGVIYACSFYNMLQSIGHLQMIWTWLVPLSLLLFERWHEKPTWLRAFAWGTAMLLQALSSWYLAVMVIIANGILVAWRHGCDWRGQWRRRAATLCAIAAASAAVIWPFAKFYTSMEKPGALEMMRLSADWRSYLIPPENTLEGQWWLHHVGTGPRWIWGEQTLYLGWIAAALAAAGLVITVWRSSLQRTVGVFAVIAALGLLLSAGPAWPVRSHHMSLFDVLTLIPGVGGFRAPGRFAALALVGLAVMAGVAIAEAQRLMKRTAAVAAIAIVPLMMAEWYVINCPLGQPQAVAIPKIYTHPALAAARAYVSLPDYLDTKEWYNGPDYLLFSTATWTPIVNGYGRSEPPGEIHVLGHMKAFPGPNNAKTLRAMGIDYVVLRSASYPDHAADILKDAFASPEYELTAQSGTDYLFHVRPAPLK